MTTNKDAETTSESADGKASSFANLAKEKRPGALAEFAEFLIHNKKWWITPILIVLFFVGLLIALTASPIAPFIYPFF
jgi:hypothetical protein